MDTVGWDDAECEDDETFKDILRFIDKYNITKVNTPGINIPFVLKEADSFGVLSRFALFSLNVYCTAA